jgi:two-component system nitrate/nitrite sensor histidine kinase NarX
MDLVSICGGVMDRSFDFFLNMLSQFAGGPGPPENNVVRFGLAAILWGALLLAAWNRQRHLGLARERLLVLGFGLSLFRDLFKLGELSYKLFTGTHNDRLCALIAPIEHILTLASLLLIAGAFLHYILDDGEIARRYVAVGFVATALTAVPSALWWPQHLQAVPEARFHETWPAAIIHLVGSGLILAALIILLRRRQWHHTVFVALLLLLISEVFVYVNFATAHAYAAVLCPVGNALYLLALPVFGYVYYHELQLGQQRAETALRSYRDHLEELVQARTEEIARTNCQLQAEIGERMETEAELARRNAELAVQNAIAATVSQSLDLEACLASALDAVLDLMEMTHGCIFLLDRESGHLQLHTQRCASAARGSQTSQDSARCRDISRQALAHMAPVVLESAQPTTASPDAVVHTLVSTPLVAQEHALGTLTVGVEGVASRRIYSLDLFTALGQQIGVAVEKAYLLHQLELTATLEERQRIAAEMHDGLAQTLSYIGHRTDHAAALLARGDVEQVGEMFQELGDTIGQAVHEVRRAIASLREMPAERVSLQETLCRAVSDLAQGSTESPRIVFDDALPRPLYLSPEALVQVVHVAQEAVTNCLRHAHAGIVRIGMAADAHRITITVQDDGCGFDLRQLATTGNLHFGMSIMQARAARIGAELAIESEPGSGTSVILSVPLPAERGDAPVPAGAPVS